jgi:uncharacterized protein involved in exopolysaccharide biosynthesis
MARKGKELALGSLRIQIDPVVLLTRVLFRQKLLLAIVAVIGGAATVVSYVRAPRKYSSRANILIRYESFDESYLQRLQNVAVGYIGSDLEMMTIINELDLYAKTRASQPYDMALRSIRKELVIKAQPRNIEVSFVSTSPTEAQRVAAFVTERVLGKMADLNEGPFNRELEAIISSIDDVEPKKRDAEQKLYEFGNTHPEIASRLADLAVTGASGGAGIDGEIRRAEADLAAARTGQVVASTARAPRATPELARLRELEIELDRVKARYTDDHPEVIAAQRKVADQKRRVQEEQASLDGDVLPGQSPEDAKKGRVARAEGRLRELLERKVEADKAAIKKPTLQREFAELSLAASTYSSGLRDLFTRQEALRRERTLAARRFQENFQLVDAARVPEIPSEPNRNAMMGAGMAVTAVIGLLLAAIRESLRQTFVDASELEQQTGLQVFAVLPAIKPEEAKS